MPKALPIKTLPIGDKIAEDGVYDIPSFRYHSDICDAPSASSSELKTISDSGEEYFVNSKYNPEYNPLADYKAHKRLFSFAHAAHARNLLGAKDWHKEDFILIPRKFNGKTFRTKDLAEWVWMQEVRKGFIAIFESEVEAVDAMAAKIVNHPEANALFSHGVPELSMVFKVGNVWIKVRPDILPVRPVDREGRVIKKRSLLTSSTRFAFSASVLSDYKTIDDNSKWSCYRSIAKFGYDMKLANIALAAVRLFGIDFTALSFGLIFQKSKPPYGITTVEIDPAGDYMHLLCARNLYAAAQFEKGMSPLLDPLGSGEWKGDEWEGYVNEVLRYTPSGEFMDQLRKMVEDGTYPNLDSKLRIVEG